MIVTKLNGGLGNQMFQYAVGRVLAITNNTELKLDLSEFRRYAKGNTKRSYELDIFNIKAGIASKKEINKLLGKTMITVLLEKLQIRNYQQNKLATESSHAFDKKVLQLSDNTYLKGYWQSEKYFKDYEEEIYKDFTFKSKPNEKNKKLLEKIIKVNSVSVHVRRGDYVEDKKTNKFHGVMGDDYYKKAIKLIEKKVKNPKYFVFSDDIDWCKENMGYMSKSEYVSNNKGVKAYEDMRLMSNCKHNIIANSSFSWWSAWLNENRMKIVIAPKKWFKDKSVNSKDIIPDSWFKI